MTLCKHNNSKEHIIPNSIGGRLKTLGFICKRCNCTTGNAWDADLANQLNQLSLFFGISRERSSSPSQVFDTTTGECVRLHANGKLSLGKPGYKENVTNGKVNIQIVARTMEEAKEMLAGVKKKHPKADIDNALENARDETTYLNGMLQFQIIFGGPTAGRSIVKTALAFAHYSGINLSCCTVSKAYLNDLSADACFGYYYEEDLVVGRPVGLPFHCVAVAGDPRTKLLLAYVEYFGCQRMVVCLSDNFCGAKISNSYAIDPILGTLVKVGVEIKIDKTKLTQIYNYELIRDDVRQKAFSDVISFGVNKRYNNVKDSVIAEAVESAFIASGAKEGEVFTEQQALKISKDIAEKVAAFFVATNHKIQ